MTVHDPESYPDRAQLAEKAIAALNRMGATQPTKAVTTAQLAEEMTLRHDVALTTEAGSLVKWLDEQAEFDRAPLCYLACPLGEGMGHEWFVKMDKTDPKKPKGWRRV